MNITFKEPVCSDKTRQRFSRILIFAMRTGFFYTVLVVSTACTLLANHDGNGQAIDSTYVTLEIKNETLKTLLKKIENQTHLRFSFLSSVKDYPVKDVPKQEMSVKEVLDFAVEKELTYHQINNSYVVIKEAKLHHSSTAIKSSNIESISNSQKAFTITGTITDATKGEPLPGVNVIVKGTARGTNSDADGRYSIAANENDILVFSFIGFKTLENPVNNRTRIDVAMEVEIASLQEVVVNAGYWSVIDKEQTGNIVKVEGKEIQKQPVANPIAALQARVPGLEITQLTGVPGGNFKVRIRGTSSIANGNDPLYIIDGVPFTSTSMADYTTSGSILGQGTSPLNGINPADIESIEVLKDADATAVYGSRGANGVILITTKKGKVGETQIDVNFYTGVGQVIRKMDLLNTEQYLTMRREAFKNDNITPTTSNARDLLVWDTTRYTDWQNELIGGTANTTDVQLSLSGGDKNTQYSIGSGYHKETTVFPGDNSDRRISVHSTITNTAFKQKLKTLVSINYTLNLSDLINQDLTSRALLLAPNAPPLFDDNGDLSWVNWSSSYENPLAYTKRKYEASTNTLIGNASIAYSILPNLEIKSSFGYTNVHMKAITTNPIRSQAPSVSAQNSSAFADTDFKNWIVEPQLNWKPRIGVGQLNLLLGSTFLDQTSEGVSQLGYGFSSEALMKNLGSAPTKSIATNNYSQYRYHKIFGRINYSLKGKYIMNVTGSRDGSSRFGPGKQFAMFGAVGVAWIFSNENFMSPISFLSFGKLRSSYGTTGNDQIGDYKYIDTYSSSPDLYQTTIGLQPDRLSNPDFAWETNKQFEVGLELGFFKDRISSSISYYRKTSSNQLVGFPLPTTTGFTTIQGNFPAVVENTGIEIVLNTRNIESPVLSWTTSFNITIPNNKLVKFPNLEEFPAYANTLKVGEPLSIRKLYNYTGIDPVTGIYTFEDVDQDAAINLNDLQLTRFVGQRFFGGVNNTLQYKGFQLDAFFQFVKQEGTNYLSSFDMPGLLANVPLYVLNRWQSEGDNAALQRFSRGGQATSAYSRFTSSQKSVSDASFIRLKNVSLSYSPPKSLIEKIINIRSVRIFVQAQNVLTLTRYKGLDPESQARQLPPLRVITGGLHLTF